MTEKNKDEDYLEPIKPKFELTGDYKKDIRNIVNELLRRAGII